MVCKVQISIETPKTKTSIPLIYKLLRLCEGRGEAMRNGKFKEGREYLESAYVLKSASRRSPASKFQSFAPLRREEDDDVDLEDREWQAIITECMLLATELKLEGELEMLDLEESTLGNRSVDEIHNLLERFVCASSLLSRESKNGTVLAHEHMLDEVLRAFEQLMTFGMDHLYPDNIAEMVNHAHTIAALEGLKMMHPLMKRATGVCVSERDGESVYLCLPAFLLTLKYCTRKQMKVIAPCIAKLHLTSPSRSSHKCITFMLAHTPAQ